MLHPDNWILCESCGAEVTCGAFVVNDHIFCCKQCYEGYPCNCGERMEIEVDRRSSQSSGNYSYG